MDGERQVDTNKKNIISEETASIEMQKLLDSYDIDGNDLEIENGPEWVKTVVNRLRRAIRNGIIEVLHDGSVRHNLTKPSGDITILTYKRVNGIAMKERDKAKAGFDKDCAFMGSLSNTPLSAMAGLDAVDISIFQRLAQLFMVV